MDKKSAQFNIEKDKCKKEYLTALTDWEYTISKFKQGNALAGEAVPFYRSILEVKRDTYQRMLDYEKGKIKSFLP